MIALDPEQTFEVTLDIQAVRPPESRQRFRFRFLTARQMMRVTELAGEIDALRRDPNKVRVGQVPLLMEILRTGLADKNLELEKDLTIAELRELTVKMLVGSDLEEAERKKSALQSASAAAGKSVPDVAAGA